MLRQTLHYRFLLCELTQTNYKRHVCSSRRYISRMYLAFISQSFRARKKKRMYLMNMRMTYQWRDIYRCEITLCVRGYASRGAKYPRDFLEDKARYSSFHLSGIEKNETNSLKRHLLLLIKRSCEINSRAFQVQARVTTTVSPECRLASLIFHLWLYSN